MTVDFGDGTAISYVNISSIDDGVKHIYNKVGIYQVSATASNHLGIDKVFLYLHVSCKSKASCKVIAKTLEFVQIFQRAGIIIYTYSHNCFGNN